MKMSVLAAILLLSVIADVAATNLQVYPSLTLYVDELPKIPKLFGYKTILGVNVPARLIIGMYEKKWKFHRDLNESTVFAYGTSAAAATVPGPCIEAIQNVSTSVIWENHLPAQHILPWDPTISVAMAPSGVPTAVHLHGGMQSPKSDGSALAWFTANYTYKGPAWDRKKYVYPNVQHAGNLWYHDHALGLTRVNLLAGLIAPYVIRNPDLDRALNLPSGPEFDQHLCIFDRSFYTNGSIYMNPTGNHPDVHPQWQPEYFGDVIVVNGKIWPYLNVQRRKYRFRIINMSNARYYNISLTNGLNFVVVGSDASYLPSPVTTSSITLSVSEIADVVIDFSLTTSNESVLVNDAPYPYPNGTPTDGLNGNVMKFIILPGSPKEPDTSTVPSTLKSYHTKILATGAGVTTRYITLQEHPSGDPTHLYINGMKFTDPVTEMPVSGSTEIWEVINLTPDDHPLHLHLASFQAQQIQQLVGFDAFNACMAVHPADPLMCNLSQHATGPIFDVPLYERTWKNAVKLKPQYVTTVMVKFNLVDNDLPYPFDATVYPYYVYHCHILDHEDNEMIRPLQLIAAPKASAE